MRSYRAQHNLLAVSANAKETAINTEQTLDTTMRVAMGNVANIEPRREHDGDEQNGYEEPTSLYDLGNTANIPFDHERAQPQHFAFLVGYALGSVSTAAAGATGYEHTITPLENDEDESRSLPSFTSAQRKGLTVLKERFASMFVNSVTATFAKDSWVKISGKTIGTGKRTVNVEEESISAAKNATTLTLATNGVAGADASTRLDNVHRIRVELSSGVWTEVTYTVVSSATPAVITIAAPGGTTDVVTYKVLYVPTEAAWASFPAEIQETPLRVAELTVTVGGKWSGSAFEGGRTLTGEINSIEWNLENNGKIEFVPGAGESYAARYFREGRLQTLKLNREFREYIMQQHISDNDTFGVYLLATGATIDGSHNYQVEMIFPKVGVLTAPLSVDGKRMAEAGDLQVLQDATYGSVIIKVKNVQTAYAA